MRLRKAKGRGKEIRKERDQQTAEPLTPMSARENKKKALTIQGHKEPALHEQAKVNLPLTIQVK
jgi:hypothetical protein